MNRNDEYIKLISELETTPPELEHTLTRGKARAKKSSKINRFFTIPFGSVATFFAAFVMMVNLSSGFAAACSGIPLIAELAAAVAFSPSLTDAVKNEFVQPIELEQTENDITMRVEYLIVDQKQINIFYTLDSEIYSAMDATPSIMQSDGSELSSFSLSAGSFGVGNGELRQFTVDFMDSAVPSELVLVTKVHDNGSNSVITAPTKVGEETEEFGEPDYISSFTFTLKFDPYFTAKAEIIELNESFVLDGQTIIAESVEIYPTHMRLNLKDDSANTAWLNSIKFYIENERGERFDTITNGISASGTQEEGSRFMASHRLESSFFSKSESLKIYITAVTWLDKDMAQIEVDLANESAENLPEGVSIGEFERKGNNWNLEFICESQKPNYFHQAFGGEYYDEAGNEYYYNRSSTINMDYLDEATGEYVTVEDKFTFSFSLENYPHDIVYLTPIYSRQVTLDTPIELYVK